MRRAFSSCSRTATSWWWSSVLLLACSSDKSSPPLAGVTLENDGGLSESGAEDTFVPPIDAPIDTGPKYGYMPGRKITVGVVDRTYAFSVPEKWDGMKEYPLVFVFHGDGGNGDWMHGYMGLETVSNEGAVFVYPDGQNATWDLDSEPPDNADIAFFDALVTEMKQKWKIDSTKIFATGYSSGGYFTNQLGCRRGTVIRAVASHESGGPYGPSSMYDNQGHLVCPEPAVASLATHSTDDDVVAVTEGYKTRDHWKWANGCDDTSDPYDPSPCVAFQNCNAGHPVIWCEASGFGHVVWPAQGSKVTWKFFSSFQ